MTVLKRLLVLSACLVVSACSWWPWGSDTPDVTPEAKTIGVVSMLSDHIAVIDATNSGWARHTAIYPLSGWQVDTLATQQITTWLQHQDGFEVRPVTASAAAFSIQALGGPVNRGGWFGRQRPSLGPVIRSSVQPANLDYYLILVEASGSTSIPDLHGIGLVHFSGKPQAFVLYHAFLVDGKTGETVSEVHADAEDEHWGAFSAIDGPNSDMPKTAWPKDVNTWSADQQTAFRQTVEAELSNSLKVTLPRLDLP